MADDIFKGIKRLLTPEPKAQPEAKAALAAWERRWEQDKEHLLALAPTPEKTPIASYDATSSAEAIPESLREILRAIQGSAPVLPKERERLLFAFDATGSRSEAWEASQQLTDVLFQAVPDQLDIALAVHGGGRVRCFTKYLTDPAKLRDQAAQIKCQGGETRLLDILDRVTWETPKAKTILYCGDQFEECDRKARRIADKLKAQGTTVIIMQEGFDPFGSDVFCSIASRTGGCVLPFDLSSVARLRDLLGAVAVYAGAGGGQHGEQLLEAKRDTQPGAVLLLEGLKTARIEGRKKQ